jgi:DNA repair protein RadC
MRVTNYELLLNDDRIPTLVKESARNYAGNSCLNNPSQIAEFMRELYHADILPEEKLWMIVMNTKCKPLGVFELAHGSMDSAVMDQKAIFTRLLLSGARGFVLVHNHPSGDSTPSAIDISNTKKVKEGAELLTIELFDHIIVGADATYCSLREQGNF